MDNRISRIADFTAAGTLKHGASIFKGIIEPYKLETDLDGNGKYIIDGPYDRIVKVYLIPDKTEEDNKINVVSKATFDNVTSATTISENNFQTPVVILFNKNTSPLEDGIYFSKTDAIKNVYIYGGRMIDESTGETPCLKSAKINGIEMNGDEHTRYLSVNIKKIETIEIELKEGFEFDKIDIKHDFSYNEAVEIKSLKINTKNYPFMFQNGVPYIVVKLRN